MKKIFKFFKIILYIGVSYFFYTQLFILKNEYVKKSNKKNESFEKIDKRYIERNENFYNKN